MADDSLNKLACFSEGTVSPRAPDDVLAAFYSVAQSLLPGLNIPFDVGFPLRNSAATSSPNYDLRLPGGVTIPKIDDKSATDMLGFLQPLMNAITMGLAILGPVKVIIDIVIAIVNVLCALPDPFKIGKAMIALMASLIPLLGLFPISAGLLILLEAVKSVIMILTAILMQILPKIDLVIENLDNARSQIFGNNPAGAEGSMQKICTVLQTLLDELAILAPINKILDTINLFMGLAVGGICATGEGCCDDCPPLVRTPPSGSCTLSSENTVDNTFTVRLTTASWSANPVGAESVGGVTIGADIPVARVIDPILLAFGQTPAATADFPLGSHLIDLATFSPAMFYTVFNFSRGRIQAETASLSNGVVTIGTAADHGLRSGDQVRISGGLIAGQIDGDYTVGATSDRVFQYESATPAFSTMSARSLVVQKKYPIQTATLGSTSNPLESDVLITLNGSIGSAIMTTYEMVADESAVISAELMTQGCRAEVSNARNDFENERDNDLLLAARTNNNGSLPAGAAFNSPPGVLLGADIPRIDEDGIKQIIVDFAANPVSAGRSAIFDKINLEIDKFRDLAARSLCLLVSSANSTFFVDQPVLDFNVGSATFTYQPRSKDNQPLLIGLPNNVEVNAIFTSTVGVLGQTQFDSTTGTYSATLSSTAPGTAAVRVFFVTNDVCSAPRDGFSALAPKELTVQFLDGAQRPQRKDRKYIQSAGGRRR
jgi:hypothetical protein